MPFLDAIDNRGWLPGGYHYLLHEGEDRRNPLKAERGLLILIQADEYALFLSHVYQLAERRQVVTTTYLSVNAALTGAIAFLFKDGQLSSIPAQVSALVFLFSGIAACSLWRRLITHYSTLIGWWYEQLRALESALPNTSKLITKEYQELFVQKRGKGPIGIRRYEASLTWLFTIIYLVFGFALLVTLLVTHI